MTARMVARFIKTNLATERFICLSVLFCRPSAFHGQETFILGKKLSVILAKGTVSVLP